MTIENAPAGDSGILSIEQAAAELDKHDETPEAEASPETPAAEAETPAAELDPEADTTPAEEEGSEAEEPGDAEETDPEAEAEAIKLEAPKWWNKEQKAIWDKISPELQAAVYAQEENRERVLQRDRQKLSESEKSTTEGKAALEKRLQVLDRVLPSAINAYKGKYADVDWVKAAQEMPPEEYQAARAEFERDTQDMHELLREQQAAEQEKFSTFVREEGEKLKTECPDLVDPVHGKQRQESLGKFLLDMQTPPERIARLSATEASLAYDAMRWRDAQRAALKVKKPAPPPQPANRPSPAAPARNPTNARLSQLRGKAKLSVDEAAELMELEGGS